MNAGEEINPIQHIEEMGWLPLYRINAHIHRHGLSQRVDTAEEQMDVPLAAD